MIVGDSSAPSASARISRRSRALLADVGRDGEQQDQARQPHQRQHDQERRTQVVDVGRGRRRAPAPTALALLCTTMSSDVPRPRRRGWSTSARAALSGACGAIRHIAANAKHTSISGVLLSVNVRKNSGKPTSRAPAATDDPPGAHAAVRHVVGHPARQQRAGKPAEGEQDQRAGGLGQRHVVVAHEERRRPRAEAAEEQRADRRRDRHQHERAAAEDLAVRLPATASCRATTRRPASASSPSWIRSCWPRTGSGRRRARIATTKAGMARK